LLGAGERHVRGLAREEDEGVLVGEIYLVQSKEGSIRKGDTVTLAVRYVRAVAVPCGQLPAGLIRRHTQMLS
jgi:hypothetical protein